MTKITQTHLLAFLQTHTNQIPIIRSSELKKHGIHRETLKRAAACGIVRKMDRGLYVRPELLLDLKQRIILACSRVPHGIVCLQSALRFHGIVSTESDVIWMAIGHKARRPALTGLNMRFVWFSGQALTQGVVNIRVDGEPIRIYSVAKTIADCLKYRRKLDAAVLTKVINEALCQTKCTRERLLHFARICRVENILRAASNVSSRN